MRSRAGAGADAGAAAADYPGPGPVADPGNNIELKPGNSPKHHVDAGGAGAGATTHPHRGARAVIRQPGDRGGNKLSGRAGEEITWSAQGGPVSQFAKPGSPVRLSVGFIGICPP